MVKVVLLDNEGESIGWRNVPNLNFAAIDARTKRTYTLNKGGPVLSYRQRLQIVKEQNKKKPLKLSVCSPVYDTDIQSLVNQETLLWKKYLQAEPASGFAKFLRAKLAYLQRQILAREQGINLEAYGNFL